jgi:quinol monooxygenase YgiN
MVTFTVRLTFEEGTRHAIAETLRLLAQASRQEPGCIHYLPNFVAEERTTVVIYEQYADEAALEHHRNSPHFLQYAADGLYKLRHTRLLEPLQTIA